MSTPTQATHTAIHWTAAEIARAQFDLDHHPINSPFWDSSDGQDTLQLIDDCGLVETTDETFRRDWHRRAMRGEFDEPREYAGDTEDGI